MNRSSEAKKLDLSDDILNDLIVDCILDIKGKNIVKLDLRELEDSPADYFIICEGESNTQIRAISDHIYARLKTEINTLPLHFEGKQHARWVCIDYFTTVVHVFYPEARAFYELEDLWSDATFTEYKTL